MNRSVLVSWFFLLVFGSVVSELDESTEPTLYNVTDVSGSTQLCDNSSEPYLGTTVDPNEDLLDVRSPTEDVTPSEPTTPGPVTTSAGTSRTKSSSLPTGVSPDPTTSETPKPIPEELCPCDVTARTCDINCCCDVDCSQMDKAVFSECLGTPPSPETNTASKLCFSSYFIYKNNTPFMTTQTDNGLFCIVQDNLPNRLKYSNQKIIDNIDSFNKVLRRKHTYSWKAPLLKGSNPNFESAYLAGQDVLLFTNESGLESFFVALKHPIPITSMLCEGSHQVKYLENSDSTCAQAAPASPAMCQRNHQLDGSKLNGWLVLASPNQVNLTHIEESVEDITIRPELTVCAGECSNRTEVPSPEPNSTHCNNLLQQVHCTLVHNGTYGLLNIQCYVHLINVSLGHQLVKQRFKFDFVWVHNQTDVFERSGRPGYIVGKPIISGTKVYKTIGDQDKEAILVSKNRTDWVSILKADGRGNCGPRVNVLFNQNMRTECLHSFEPELFRPEDRCRTLQTKVLKLLMGATLNEQEYVSCFGDPVPEAVDQWVPLIFENLPTQEGTSCRELHTELRVRVVYGLVGRLGRGQAKVVAVTAATGPASGGRPDPPPCCTLRLAASVSFTDVSRMAVSHFAQAPIVKIRFPHDFFYPFSSSFRPGPPSLPSLILITSLVYSLWSLHS